MNTDVMYTFRLPLWTERQVIKNENRNPYLSRIFKKEVRKKRHSGVLPVTSSLKVSKTLQRRRTKGGSGSGK